MPTPMTVNSQALAEPGWERDLSVLMCDCIDPTSFIAVVRASSGTGGLHDFLLFDLY
jgi:hypothetical protein